MVFPGEGDDSVVFRDISARDVLVPTLLHGLFGGRLLLLGWVSRVWCQYSFRRELLTPCLFVARLPRAGVGRAFLVQDELTWEWLAGHAVDRPLGLQFVDLECSLCPRVLLWVLLAAAAFRLQARRWFAGGLLEALVDCHGGLDLALIHLVLDRVRFRRVLGVEADPWSGRPRVGRDVPVFLNLGVYIFD